MPNCFENYFSVSQNFRLHYSYAVTTTIYGAILFLCAMFIKVLTQYIHTNNLPVF